MPPRCNPVHACGFPPPHLLQAVMPLWADCPLGVRFLTKLVCSTICFPGMIVYLSEMHLPLGLWCWPLTVIMIMIESW